MQCTQVIGGENNKHGIKLENIGKFVSKVVQLK